MKMNNRKGKNNPMTDKRFVSTDLCYRVEDISLDALVGDGKMIPLGEGFPGGDEGGTGGGVAKTAEQIAAEKAATEKAATEAAAKVKADADAAAAAAAGAGTGTGDDAPKAVELDGVKYKLDDKGNALKEDGTVFKTVEELIAIEADQDEPVTVEFIKKVGIQPLDETGKPKTYEDTVEGLMQAANDIAEQKALSAQKELFNAYPKAEKYIRHLAAGGDDASFFNFVKDDFSKVVIDEKNVEQQKQILKSLYVKRGFAPEKADKQIKYLEQAGELNAESQEALATLKADQAKAEADKQAADARAMQEQEKNIKQYWENVGQVVTKGTVKDIVIPEAIRKDFFNYMSTAVNNEGHSQAMIDANKEDVETRIMIDLMRFLKYDTSALVKAAIAKEKVRTLRTRVSKSSVSAGGGAPASGAAGGGANSDITIDKLM